uniref:Uncharacterized protein n=1 Tax=Lactuca sativa TaxID=4236 RepID=A0A9R1WCK6_LACSA|nr:hypothetical protein LSAT_V11C200095810 [Lactuca sativa]
MSLVTRAIPRPVQKEREDQDAFDIREENWLCKNGEIVTMHFVYTTTDMAHQYHLLSGLLSKSQQPGQTISAFLSEVQVIWDQLTLAGPTFKCQEDAIISTTHQKQQHLMIFLMALQDHYEPVRSSLLHRSPLPTLEAAIAELISEETRLGVPASSTSLSTDGVLAVPFHKGVRNFTSNKPQFPHNRKSSQCSYCHDNDRIKNITAIVCGPDSSNVPSGSATAQSLNTFTSDDVIELTQTSPYPRYCLYLTYLSSVPITFLG